MVFRIDLSDVLAIYVDRLGPDSLFSSGFIQRVEADEGISTLATQDSGVLRYNPNWCQKHIKTTAMLEDALMHELMHHVQADSVRIGNKVYDNLCSDAAINSVLKRMGLSCSLMKSFYPETGDTQCLLRPGAVIDRWSSLEIELRRRVREFYSRRLYPLSGKYHHWESRNLPTPEEVAEVVKQIPGGNTHSCGWDPKTSTIGNAEILDSLMGDLRAGYSSTLGSWLTEIERGRKGMRLGLLKDFLCNNLLAKIEASLEDPGEKNWAAGRLKRRDLIDLACGFEITGFWNPEDDQTTEQRGIYMYVDVSGSEFPYLPKVLGIIASTLEVDGVFQFSNKVVEMHLSRLRDGGGKVEVDTTGGTDFDCVVEHAVKHRHKKIVVVTDGCASTGDKMKDLARQHIEKLCLVYTPHADHKNFFHEHFKRWVSLEGIL